MKKGIVQMTLPACLKRQGDPGGTPPPSPAPLACLASAVTALFLTYLFHRRISFPVLNFIFVFILLWGLLLFLSLLYLKKIHFAALTRMQLRTAFVLAGVLTLAAGCTNTNLYLHNYRATDVVIEALPQTKRFKCHGVPNRIKPSNVVDNPKCPDISNWNGCGVCATGCKL